MNLTALSVIGTCRFSGSKERKETVPYFNDHRQRFVRSSNSCSVVWLLGWDFRNLGCLYSAKSRKFHGRIGPEFIAWRASLHTTSDRDSSSLRDFWETIGYQHPRPLSLSRYRLVSNVLPFKLSSSFGQYQPTYWDSPTPTACPVSRLFLLIQPLSINYRLFAQQVFQVLLYQFREIFSVATMALS